MPFLQIQMSENLPESEAKDLISAVSKTVIAKGDFDPEKLRTWIQVASQQKTGTGNKGFVHANLRIRPGNPQEKLKEISTAGHRAFCDFFEKHPPKEKQSISWEITELNESLFVTS